MKLVTVYHRCTKCDLPCAAVPTPSQTRHGGELLEKSLCCNAPVKVVGAKD